MDTVRPVDVLELGEYRFDRANQILSRGGEELPLPPRALGVLSRLLEEPGNVVSKQTLLDSVWNGAYVTETSLSEAVGLLREALQDAPQEPRFIQTVHRRGYRFICPVRVPNGTPVPAPETDPPPPPQGRRWIREIALGMAAALALAALGVIAAVRTHRPPAERPLVVRFGVAPPPPYELYTKAPSLAVSRDGRHLVYTARRGEESVLFHREIAGLASREIPGTRGARVPFFSPEGRRVGFFHDGQLVAVPLSGGAALPLARVHGPLWGADWGEDDSIVFAAGLPATLHRAWPGGATERVTEHAPGPAINHFWPRILPGGKAVLFTAWSNTIWDARVEWRSLVTGEQRTVLTGASDCRFASGLLVCAHADGTIVTAPFDPGEGRLTGPPLPLLRDAAIHASAGFATLAVGGRTLIYTTGPRDYEPRTLQRLVSGTSRPLGAPPRIYRNFSEGPAGEIAVTILDRARSDVWVLHAANGAASRLTFEHFNVDPVWSPDGRWVAFASREENGPFNLYRRRADGSGAVERLTRSQWDQSPLAWSPDGRELLLRQSGPDAGVEVRLLDFETRTQRAWPRAHPKTIDAVWSPDGKFVAYTSGETGRWEIYVRSYPGGEGRWQISSEGGENPSWSADGRTIYFQQRQPLGHASALWTVPVEPRGGELSPGAASLAFSDRSMLLGAAGPGGVLLLANGPQPPQATEVRVVLEWPSSR